MLASYLEAYFQDQELKIIFQNVLGNKQPGKIQLLLDASVHHYFGSTIKKILFIQSSIGVVFGLLLANNRQVILKVYSPKLRQDYLDKMNAVQTIFHQEKFPAPAVLSPIFKFGSTQAGFYQLIEGCKENAHQKIIRLELSRYLAEFTSLCERHNLLPLENFFQQASQKKLWPMAHNPLFNIQASSRGAGWIAKKARQAKKIIASCKQVEKLAHTDWGTKNAIFVDKKLVGVFDWDSLGTMTEPEMVGRAAAQFTADWETEFKTTPSPLEGRLFVEAYEDYRGKKFSKQEYRIISASSDYLIATIARFEHAGKNSALHPYQDLLRLCSKKSFLFS